MVVLSRTILEPLRIGVGNNKDIGILGRKFVTDITNPCIIYHYEESKGCEDHPSSRICPSLLVTGQRRVKLFPSLELTVITKVSMFK